MMLIRARYKIHHFIVVIYGNMNPTVAVHTRPSDYAAQSHQSAMRRLDCVYSPTAGRCQQNVDLMESWSHYFPSYQDRFRVVR